MTSLPRVADGLGQRRARWTRPSATVSVGLWAAPLDSAPTVTVPTAAVAGGRVAVAAARGEAAGEGDDGGAGGEAADESARR